MQLTLPLPELDSPGQAAPPTAAQRIFCNRSLRLDQIDWIGFDIPDEFVVGYGIDFAQRNRNLPFIGKVRFVE